MYKLLAVCLVAGAAGFLPSAVVLREGGSSVSEPSSDVTSAVSETSAAESSADVSSSGEASSVLSSASSAVTYEYTVKAASATGGQIVLTAEQANAGDVITIYPNAYILYKVSGVLVNSYTITANADGLYQFTAGDTTDSVPESETKVYTVSALFETDNEKIQYLTELVQKASEGDWSSIFSVQNLLTLLYFILSSVGIFTACAYMIKSKKLKSATLTDVTSVLGGQLNTAVDDSVKKYFNEVLAPLMSTLSDKTSDMDSTSKTLARCFCLMMEDTPESRLAIIKELTNLNSNDKELSEKVTKIINEQMEKAKADDEATKKAIEDLKASNDSLGSASDEKKADVSATTAAAEDTYGKV